MLISSVLLLLFFCHKKPLKCTFNPGLKQARKKTTGKYEVHEKTSCTCWQKRKRDVTLTGFNIFRKGTDILYVVVTIDEWSEGEFELNSS